MNGGDFNWDFNLVAVTQVDMEEDGEDEAESCLAILREPGPGLAGESGMMFTNEYTGNVILLVQTVDVEGGTADLSEP